MTKPGPGKFENNPSQEASEILYQHALDGSHDDIGDSEFFGWYVLILGSTLEALETTVCPDYGYICVEDSRGFFTYLPYSNSHEIMEAWGNIQHKWNEVMIGAD